VLQFAALDMDVLENVVARLTTADRSVMFGVAQRDHQKTVAALAATYDAVLPLRGGRQRREI
jgi:hypothetical protein